MNFEYYIIILAIVWFGRYLYTKNEQADTTEDNEKLRKERLTELVENQKERTDLSLFDEDKFWEIVKEAKAVSQNRYEYFLGAFKFRVQKQGVNQLIPIDNLIRKLYEDSYTHLNVNAGNIFFQNSSVNLFLVFISLMIMEGRIFYENASMNPELMANRSFEEVVGRDLSLVVEDLYLELKGELIPLCPKREVKIKGKEIKPNEIPRTLPDLWSKYV